jgi:hypothetical protein
MKNYKKLILLISLLLTLTFISVSSKDIIAGYFCWCYGCGYTHSGTTQVHVCPVCHSTTNCTPYNIKI